MKASNARISCGSPGRFVRWICVDPEGCEHELKPRGFDSAEIFSMQGEAYALLRQFATNELVHSTATAVGPAPKHIQYMQTHELVDYCDVSEKGHLKWYPRGVLLQQLITDYARELARDWGAVEMRNPILIRSDANLVGELMGEFHERDYRADGGRGVCYLRYASDPLAFPFMQRVRFSHKQGPLRLYEEANCFRNEQEGEVSGLKRVRSFTMTDMHAACVSDQQAQQEFRYLSLAFADLMHNVIAGDRWVLGWEATVSFYEQYRDFLFDIVRSIGVPALFKLMPAMSHYYAIKSEYQSISADGSNIQISTVQWDVKDGPRFGIGYTTAEGEKVNCPVIIHASSFGSIERTLCALLENVAVDESEGEPPMLPYWLSPTQVRLIPVSAGHLRLCLDLARQLTTVPTRCDVDDREETVGKKIRLAERDWVPYVLVVGEREAGGEQPNVRVRRTGIVARMSFEKLRSELIDQQASMPYRRLPTQLQVSQNVRFYG